MGLVILCPGQGNQHPGMFDALQNNAAAQEVLDEAVAVLGFDLREALRNSPPENIFANRFAQPLLCACALAAWRALRGSLPQPLLFAGYSVGELAAYGCAGALSLADTLRLAIRRAELMDEAGGAGTGMLALRGLNQARVAALCHVHNVEIAIINGPDHFVVGGISSALELLKQAALVEGAHTAKRLPVDVASHTSVLREAGQKFAAPLAMSALNDPPIPVAAGVSGAVVRSREAALCALSSQLYLPLQWSACLQTAVEMRARVLLELGPGASLARIAREIYPELPARSVEEFKSLEGAANWIMKQIDKS